MKNVFDRDREKLQEMLYLREIEGWSIHALTIKFECGSRTIKKYLELHEVKQPKKIKVTSRTGTIQKPHWDYEDIDGDRIKPPKSYKQLLMEAEERDKKIRKIYK